MNNSMPTPLNGDPKDTASSSSSSTARYTSAGPAGAFRLGKVQVLERGENMFAPCASLSADGTIKDTLLAFMLGIFSRGLLLK